MSNELLIQLKRILYYTKQQTVYIS